MSVVARQRVNFGGNQGMIVWVEKDVWVLESKEDS